MNPGEFCFARQLTRDQWVLCRVAVVDDAGGVALTGMKKKKKKVSSASTEHKMFKFCIQTVLLNVQHKMSYEVRKSLVSESAVEIFLHTQSQKLESCISLQRAALSAKAAFPVL